MPERIDHVIVAAEDLAALEATFRRLGFSVTGGGTHPHLGTRNRIIVLGDGYLELLAIADAARVSSVLASRLSAGEGWVGCVLQSVDITAEVADLRWRGVDVRGPSIGRLVAPAGSARGWRVATVGSDDFWAAVEPLPALIQHDTVGERHRIELAGSEGLARHANGAIGLRDVVIAVASLDEAAQTFADVNDLLATEPAQRDEALGADVLCLALPSGESLQLAQPNGAGLAQRRLDAAGEGICRVSVTGADLAVTSTYLSTQGVPFDAREGALLIAPEASAGAALCLVAGK
jgi:hypothetical protein